MAAPSSSTPKVSEHIFEYLLAEMILLDNYRFESNSVVRDGDVGSSSSSSVGGMDEEAAAKAARRLDAMGYDVGYRLVESVMEKQKEKQKEGSDAGRLGTEPLELIKFVCKEFWEEVFSKKIDKLQTNHRGVFVLSDFKFKWLEHHASDDIVTKKAAARILHFPCGLVKGALANLGLTVVVNAEFNVLPSCTFNVKVIKDSGGADK